MKRTGRDMSAVLTDAQLAGIRGLLHDRIGLVLDDRRDEALRAAIDLLRSEGRLSGQHGPDATLAVDSALFERFVGLVTIGETYFFRHPEQLAGVRAYLADLVASRRNDPPERFLRIWTAGCATGEETYTLAIMAAELTAGEAGWDIRVLGTDVDAHAIHVAREATYGRWSFRSPIDTRERWFEAVGDRRRVAAPIRGLVRFAVDNLAGPAHARQRLLDRPADLVSCRNVLMYLHGAARQRAVTALVSALAEHGLLLVAPVESSRRLIGDLRRHDLAGTTFYRPPQGGTVHEPVAARRIDPAASARRGQADFVDPRRAGPEHRQPSPPAPRKGPVKSESPTNRAQRPPEPPVEALAEVRRLADAGAYEEAVTACEQLVRRSPSRDAYLLRAALAEAMGDPGGAIRALRRALDMDPGDPAVRFRLGLLEWRAGRPEQARGLLRSGLELTARLDTERTAQQTSTAAELARLQAAATALLARLE